MLPSFILSFCALGPLRLTPRAPAPLASINRGDFSGWSSTEDFREPPKRGVPPPRQTPPPLPAPLPAELEQFRKAHQPQRTGSEPFFFRQVIHPRAERRMEDFREGIRVDGLVCESGVCAPPAAPIAAAPIAAAPVEAATPPVADAPAGTRAI